MVKFDPLPAIGHYDEFTLVNNLSNLLNCKTAVEAINSTPSDTEVTFLVFYRESKGSQ